MGVKSEIRTLTPTYYLDFSVDPGAQFSQPIHEGWTTFAYTLTGNLKFGILFCFSSTKFGSKSRH